MGKYWTKKTDGVDPISAEDFNIAFEDIEYDFSILDKKADDNIAAIENSLDAIISEQQAIIAIQNSFIGGD